MSRFSAIERSARLLPVEAAALDIYRDAERANAFLGRPHAMLVGKSPRAVALESDVGANAVINLLGRAAYSGGV